MTKDFGDFVDEGRALMQARDTNAWALGDLAVDFEITVGRPADPDAPTLSDLANAWDASTQRVSEWRNCSKFYLRSVRTFECPWELYNAARRAAQKEHRDYEEALEEALKLLTEATRQHMGVNAFRRFLSGTLYEGIVSSLELPEHIRGVIPDDMKSVWVVVKKPEEN